MGSWQRGEASHLFQTFIVEALDPSGQAAYCGRETPLSKDVMTFWSDFHRNGGSDLDMTILEGVGQER
jgi:hypothetical protein